MNDVGILHFVLFAVCLLLAAFFCSAEAAFIGIQKLRLQHLIRTGNRAAETAARIIQKPEKFLATVLLGVNLFETAVAAIGTIIAVSFWGENLGAVLAIIILTILTLVLVELIPKSLAARHAEKLTLIYARPIEVISVILYPFVFVLSRIGISMTKLVSDDTQVKPTTSEAEFRTAIDISEEEGIMEESEAEMLHNVFKFGDRKVYEVLVPRPETTFIEKGISLADFFTIYAQSPFSRFPVYQGNQDNVVGMISVEDVLMGLAKGEINQQSIIDSLIRPAYFTLENKLVSHLFAEMLGHNHHMAVVVDEYGAAVGVVSLDQMTSSIVGPIVGELEKIEKEYEIINDNTYQIDGGMRVDEVNEQMELGLPKDGYETMAGFILNLLSRIPKQGEQLKYKNLKIVITKVQGAKIIEVLVTKEVDNIIVL
ncbi:hemolysin family protein [Chloroflexota bacterium]